MMASHVLSSSAQALEAADFDFMFTESELHDMLGFVEHQGRSVEAECLPSSQPLLGAPNQYSTIAAHGALQFQPRSEATAQSYSQATLQGADFIMSPPAPFIEVAEANFVTCSAPPSDAAVATEAGPSFGLPAAQNGLGAGYDGAHSIQAPSSGNLPPGRHDNGTQVVSPQPSGPAPLPGTFSMTTAHPASSPNHGNKATTNPKASKEGKAQVSHSTIEKQRRDRINSLIDELRDLVPPNGHIGSDSTDTKRPKHVVLSDTISLVKELQKVAKSPSHNSDANDADSSDLLSGESGCITPGVVVERKKDGTESSLVYVKVTCPDRRGLLADILTALKMLPLQVSRAAVTTNAEGMVQDVFEVILDPGMQSSDLAAVQEAVQDAVFQLVHIRDKRRRE